MGLESEHVSETVEHVRNSSQPELEPEHVGNSPHQPELEPEDEDEKILNQLSSLSSSSSSSSSHSLLEIDFDSKNPFLDEGDQLRTQESISSLDQSQWSMTSTSPPTVDPSSLPMASPKPQTMGTPTGYDPNRIPLSVFCSKPANAAEWSTASNESLFSIHMGNNSFSKDMWRSGELSRLDELECSSHSFSPFESKGNELGGGGGGGLYGGLPPVMEVSANEENGAKMSNASRIDSSNSLKVVVPEFNKMIVDASTASRLSGESSRSSSSFAFPVLASDSGKTSSLKGVEEKAGETEQQIAESKTTQKSSIGRWFSWFSCLPRCC